MAAQPAVAAPAADPYVVATALDREHRHRSHRHKHHRSSTHTIQKGLANVADLVGAGGVAETLRHAAAEKEVRSSFHHLNGRLMSSQAFERGLALGAAQAAGIAQPAQTTVAYAPR